MRFVGIIPARYDSQRLPGKPLLDLAGKPLIQWVYEGASGSSMLADLWVATDDRRIFSAVESFGGKVTMTSPQHCSGTDRVAEAASRLEADVFVNIQGDEPLISPITVDAICQSILKRPETQIATARIRLAEAQDIADPNQVKVVCDESGRALYFSRASIPYPRSKALYFKHLGIYAYRAQTLSRIASLPPSPLELSEGLEQLRFLENRIPIQVVELSEDAIGVDTHHDVERVTPLLENTGK